MKTNNRNRIRHVVVTLAIAVGVVSAGCEKKGGLDGVTGPAALASISITPNPQSLGVGVSQQFTAVGKDASGNVVVLGPVTWSVVAGGGLVNATGNFTAGGAVGTFANTVQATSGGMTATATVMVTAGPLATIVVTPNPATLAPGQPQTFTAVGRDATGNVVAITPTWSVVSGGGAIVAASGAFTAGAVAGTFANTVRATSGTLSGSATVVVTPPLPTVATITVTPNPASVLINTNQQFIAVGRDATGTVIGIAPVWSVVNGGGAINASSGAFTAGATAGSFANTVQATSGGVSGTATVIVTEPAPPAPVLTTIIVTPNPASLQTGDNQQFVAVGRDANGGTMSITPVWSVVNGGGAINASTGRFTAGNNSGTFNNTVTATSGGVSGTATVVVTDPPAAVVATINVRPDPVNVTVNGRQQFRAVGRDADGNEVPISPVWTVVNGGGTIDRNSGVFTAGSNTGTFTNTVRATERGVSDEATVRVVDNADQPLVDLGNWGIMAGTAFTCVTGGIINADIAISPGSTVTGFPPCVIRGEQHLNDATAVQAQIELTDAYNTLMGLPCPPANRITANLGGTTKEPGVYCSASSIGVTGTLTLDGNGDRNAIFVFQAGSTLTTAGNVFLTNGAQAKNVYWVVGSSATIGTASQWQGSIIALTSITLVDYATLIGRALARNGAVTMTTGNIITLP